MAVHRLTSVDPLNRKAVSPTVQCSGFNEVWRRASLQHKNSIQDKSRIGIEVFWKLSLVSSDDASPGSRPEADIEWVGVKGEGGGGGVSCLSRSLINFPSFCEVVWAGAYTHSFVRHRRQQIQYTRTPGCYYLYTGTPIVRAACKCVVLRTRSICTEHIR